MNTKNTNSSLDPNLALLLDVDTPHESQISARGSLFEDALRHIRQGDDELCEVIEKKLRLRQLRLQRLQERAMAAYRDNFELLTQLLKARAVRTVPQRVDTLAGGAPFPVTARQREIMKHKVDVLHLPTRARNALIGENVYTIEDLLELREMDLMKVPMLGRQTIKAIRNALALHDFRIGHLYDPNKPIPRVKWEGEN